MACPSTSYQALEKWYDATTSANSRKGSAPLPIMIVGTKIDDTKNRDVKISQVDFAKKRGLPYFEISSKANYGVKELVLSIVKSLLGWVALFFSSQSPVKLIALE
jgi:GTPase SAR1 family protein